MRETKYRFWHPVTKHMYADTGLSSLGVNDALRVTREAGYVPLEYVGVKTKSGVEVFEGDILEIEQDSRIGVVVYHGCGFKLKLYKTWFGGITKLIPFATYENDLKVLGNIYENPELLSPPETNKGGEE